MTSWWLNLETNTSFVQFGEIDSSYYTGKAKQHDIVVTKDTWWTLNLDGCDYGSNNIQTGNTKYAIVDTGTSLLTLTSTDYANLTPYFVKAGMECGDFEPYCHSD